MLALSELRIEYNTTEELMPDGKQTEHIFRVYQQAESGGKLEEIIRRKGAVIPLKQQTISKPNNRSSSIAADVTGLRLDKNFST